MHYEVIPTKGPQTSEKGEKIEFPRRWAFFTRRLHCQYNRIKNGMNITIQLIFNYLLLTVAARFHFPKGSAGIVPFAYNMQRSGSV